MADLSNIKGLQRLLDKLQQRAAKARKDGKATVAVGYSARYAIYVHENLEQKLKGQPRPSGLGVYWGPSGQPKYLEGPFRRMAQELKSMIREGIQRGLTMAQALLRAGLRLQRESQKLVPVEYGILKASAFTRLEQ